MLWGLGIGGEIQLKITHSLTHSLTHFVRQLIYALNLDQTRFSHISPPWQVCLIVQSHAIGARSVRI